MLTILFDENLSFRYARALNELDNGSCLITSINDLGMNGAIDEKIIEYGESKKGNFIVCTSDKDFKQRKLYPIARKSKNIGLFLFRFRKISGRYDQFKFIMKHWVEIRDLSLSNRTPFAYEVNARKILKM
jgi:predicted nuclease of predicted toxin-antitoxin system